MHSGICNLCSPTLNKCVSYLTIVNKSFVNVTIINWLATTFVELTISISELLVSFITSEVKTIKSCLFLYISNHLKCLSLHGIYLNNHSKHSPSWSFCVSWVRSGEPWVIHILWDDLKFLTTNIVIAIHMAKCLGNQRPIQLMQSILLATDIS